jgi:hypothetical protein
MGGGPATCHHTRSACRWAKEAQQQQQQQKLVTRFLRTGVRVHGRRAGHVSVTPEIVHSGGCIKQQQQQPRAGYLERGVCAWVAGRPRALRIKRNACRWGHEASASAAAAVVLLQYSVLWLDIYERVCAWVEGRPHYCHTRRNACMWEHEASASAAVVLLQYSVLWLGVHGRACAAAAAATFHMHWGPRGG